MGLILGETLHPSVPHEAPARPEGRKVQGVELSSAPDVPSLRSALGSCNILWLSHAAEGRTNHFDQIRRSTKITQDQGE